MPVLITFLLSLLLGGCSPDPAGNIVINADVLLDPHDPASIARWEASEYNVFHSKVKVIDLEYFHGSLGDGKPKKSQRVAVYMLGAKIVGAKPEQEAAIQKLLENEAALYAAAREAVYNYYKENYLLYHQGMSIGAKMYGGEDEIDDLLPKIVIGNEIDELVRFSEIYIHVPMNGKPSVGIHCEVEWDPEHGMGLRIADGGQVSAGSVDLAFEHVD